MHRYYLRMKTLSIITFLLSALQAHACGPIKIAVIDTGFGFNNVSEDTHLCKTGHKDFSSEQMFAVDSRTTYPMDTHGHGTNVVGLIEQYADKGNLRYCIVVIKFYTPRQTGKQNQRASTKAFNYAAKIGAKFINYSAGGVVYNAPEFFAIEAFLNKGGRIISAAGNENQNLDIIDNTYYPAMYDLRITVVGNNNKFGVKSLTSNYGNRVDSWEIGENQSAYGITMTGTSQATAIHTGKILSELHNTCDIGR